MKRLLLLLTVVSVVVASYSQESAFTPIDKNLYPNNMTMVIQLMDGDAEVNTAEVAAFVDGECRGAARATNGLYYLVVSGEGAGQAMILRMCRDGSIYAIDDTQQFVSDGNVGTSWEPYVIDLQGKKPAVMKGDANGDGVVNVADEVATASYILNMMPPTFVKESADVDDNGVVNAADLVGIVNIILNEM